MEQTELVYARQEQLLLSVPSSVTVVGVGGVGTWVAIQAAMSGVGELHLFDADVLEEHNRNRLPFCQGGLNRPKVDVVADFIRAIRPDCLVWAIHERLEGEDNIRNQLQISHTIVDCTDSPRTQIELYKVCGQYGGLYIRAGYDGTHITVSSSVPGWIKNAERETYEINPSWVVPSVVVAALAVGKLMKYPDQEVSLEIGEIGIPMLNRIPPPGARCRQSGSSETSTRTRRRR